MIEYTEDEIKLLIGMYEVAFEGGDLPLIRMCWYGAPVFHCPLEDVPLYMANWPTVVRWRFRIGK